MRIIARATLRQFWQDKRYRESEQALRSWFDEASSSLWKEPQDVKAQYRNASFLANNRVVFNIHGNKYRLVVAFKYELGICYIRFIGTHSQYDAIHAQTI